MLLGRGLFWFQEFIFKSWCRKSDHGKIHRSQIALSTFHRVVRWVGQIYQHSWKWSQSLFIKRNPPFLQPSCVVSPTGTPHLSKNRHCHHSLNRSYHVMKNCNFISSHSIVFPSVHSVNQSVGSSCLLSFPFLSFVFFSSSYSVDFCPFLSCVIHSLLAIGVW